MSTDAGGADRSTGYVVFEGVVRATLRAEQVMRHVLSAPEGAGVLSENDLRSPHGSMHARARQLGMVSDYWRVQILTLREHHANEVLS